MHIIVVSPKVRPFSHWNPCWLGDPPWLRKHRIVMLQNMLWFNKSAGHGQDGDYPFSWHLRGRKRNWELRRRPQSNCSTGWPQGALKRSSSWNGYIMLHHATSCYIMLHPLKVTSQQLNPSTSIFWVSWSFGQAVGLRMQLQFKVLPKAQFTLLRSFGRVSCPKSRHTYKTPKKTGKNT